MAFAARVAMSERTGQGAISRKHLDYYLDEFTFWFNRRNSRKPRKAFPALRQAGRGCGTNAVQIDGEVLRNG